MSFSKLCKCENFFLASPKRGLVYVGAGDDLWEPKGSDLTWYYNFAPSPSLQGSDLEYVPMLWGDRSEDSGFDSTVENLLQSGINVKHVLGMNEPDLCADESAGGSCIEAKKAASIWKQEIEPLKHQGISLGAPAVTQGGLWWLQDFYTECDGGCSTDFLPIHVYSDFVGLASYVGPVHETYPNMSIWVTELAYPNATVPESEHYYNQTVDFLDGLDYVARYSYFGSFPPDAASSWVGSGGTMMNNDGELTNIGAWYLGMSSAEAGTKPESAAMILSRPCLPAWVLLGALWAFVLELG
ncbi:uncharacterized protein LTR77_001689 [Saxophila tyrrhenica]|uniref:Asl1-like glycosyl hydrolase catalytic domain-containing protein n=1 Tax=Saxophila tyrrhenica TaxID=1690608 RepID=A0AAV9PNK7_9PEZI|nr:hypothetical protein LTR77_001689 [Saxophila tyrrhenica]